MKIFRRVILTLFLLVCMSSVAFASGDFTTDISSCFWGNNIRYSSDTLYIKVSQADIDNVFCHTKNIFDGRPLFAFGSAKYEKDRRIFYLYFFDYSYPLPVYYPGKSYLCINGKTNNVYFSFYDNDNPIYSNSSMNYYEYERWNPFFYLDTGFVLSGSIFPNNKVDKPLLPNIDTVHPVSSVKLVTEFPVGNFFINYKYSDGSVASPPFSADIALGEDYSFPSPDIEFYETDMPVVAGTMSEDSFTVDVVYTPKSYALSIDYLLPDGSNAFKPFVTSLPYKSNYSYTVPMLDYYNPSLTEVSGVMAGHDVNVDVDYVPMSYNLSINYLMPDGSNAFEPFVTSLPYNSSYSFAVPALKGYTSSLKTVSGVMAGHDVSIDVSFAVMQPLDGVIGDSMSDLFGSVYANISTIFVFCIGIFTILVCIYLAIRIVYRYLFS